MLIKKAIKKFDNIPYKQGSWDIKNGVDCVSMVSLFFKELGYDTDKIKKGTLKYKGKNLTTENYFKIIPEKEHQTMLISFFDKFFKKKDSIINIKKCDIVIYNLFKSLAIGIYLGQGAAIFAVNDQGTKILKLKNNNIKKVYQWQD